MVNYYKYLPVSKEDESWGLSVLNTGCTHIEATNIYPFKSHPAHHNFNWNSWRILQEYQIIYITNGKGVFESENFKQTVVNAGTVIVLFPNERHRYKPDSQTGWDEYWVGVRGNVIDNLLDSGYLKRENPCLYIGFNEDVFNIYNCIIEKTKLERPGYQPLISGAVLHLLGTCHATIKQNATENKEEEIIINKARLLFRSNINNPYSPEKAAEELNVGYSWFRKLFKNYTGLSPGQYYLQLKIEKAKELLSNTDAPIKEISFDLNFDSNFYFSKIFKEKTGIKPTDYRKGSKNIL
ncbi:AraC family transcriptional regulator [Mucilaginibacter segetis]|uniref:AraC family transcriptional regulator n=1 Tax=Mucilaginibacter segetis TaxID=2793071 RepID=A0A934ULY2_9SPHI|nr:AraC family transcriptional regulator [Mucilaginibacter segetis]MBK0378445.1 AraC family transcriptional regulator [Mucilaginibacter segetis]